MQATKSTRAQQFAGRPTLIMPTAGPTETRPTVTVTEETGYSMLIRSLADWNGTQDEVTRLAALRYPSGEYIVSTKRKDILLEILGMLRDQGFAATYQFLSQAEDPDFILWQQKSMEESQNKVLREMKIKFAEPVGIKGVAVCRKCGSKEVAVALRQTRSGDEPMTTFYQCVKCGFNWREN